MHTASARLSGYFASLVVSILPLSLSLPYPIALALPPSVPHSSPPPSLSHPHLPSLFPSLLLLNLSPSPSLSPPLLLPTIGALRFARGFNNRCTYPASRLIGALRFARGFKKVPPTYGDFDFFFQNTPDFET